MHCHFNFKGWARCTENQGQNIASWEQTIEGNKFSNGNKHLIV